MAKVYHNGAWEDCVPRVLGYGTDTFTSLPAMIYSNLNTPLDYQIYGNTGGVGDRTDNVYNTSETTWSADGTILDDNGSSITSSSHYTTNFTAVKPETTYYLSGTYRVGISTIRIYFYDENKSWISRSAQIDTATIRAFTTPANCEFIQIQVAKQLSSTSDWCVKEGTTPLKTYVPYGYEVDISTSDGTGTTTTPIYIGSDPLGKDEYVDYAEQKVYRMIDGTLTPTDPPIPLPALPTFSGNTVIDCNGISKPSSVVATYTGWHEQSELIRRNDDWTTLNVQLLSALQSPLLSFTPIENEDTEEVEERGEEV